MFLRLTLFLVLFITPSCCLFAQGNVEHLQGSVMSLWWVLPFVGILLSLALMPIVLPRLWHHHYGKVAFIWSAITIGSMLLTQSLSVAWFEIGHTIFHHYIPFIILISALYIISLDIKIELNVAGIPFNNVLFIFCGGLTASLIGTTGASMVLIQPLLHMNRKRIYKTHLIIFFIFIVSNIGGALTPLGDPPLFLGFLEGVPFFWTLKNLIMPQMLVMLPLLLILWMIDAYFHKKEGVVADSEANNTHKKRLKISGFQNIVLLGLVMATVLFSGISDERKEVALMGVSLGVSDILRDSALLILVCIALFSKKRKGAERVYTWGPLIEVTKIFAAIFITAMPVIAILKAGENGALGFVTAKLFENGVPLNGYFFWITGLLSGFLDNAPTYLIFFHLASGDVVELTTKLSSTLIAISTGAVFMGALTYIGNAPNFMVKSIAEEKGIRMPSFFGYMAWSMALLLPLLGILSLVYFV